MSLPATDSFTGTGVLSGSWTTQLGTPQRSSGAFHGFSAGENVAFWNADAFANDQYAQCVLNDADAYGGPMVRASGTAGTAKMYWALMCSVASGGTGVLYKYVSGTYTSLGTLNMNSGHTAKLQIVGSNLTIFDNGVSALTASDSAITSGSGGIGVYTLGNPNLGSFQADNVGGSGGFFGTPVNAILAGQGNC